MRNATRTSSRSVCAAQLRRRRRAALMLARGLNSDGRIAYGRNVLQVFGWVGTDVPGTSSGSVASSFGRA